MRLQTYLTEGNRSKPISLKRAGDIVEKECKKFFSTGVKIFRGLGDPSNNILYVNPRKGPARRSANTANYYTWLVDDLLPSWKEYPKRSYSLICATVYGDATHYGDVFTVLPFDNSKIGICSDMDFWSSFPNVERMGGPKVDGDQMDIFNSDLADMFRLVNSIQGRNFSLGYQHNKSLEDFSDALNRLGDAIDNGSITKSYGRLVPTFYKFLSNKKKGESIIKYFDRVLSPTANGFSLTKAGATTKLPNSREVWTEGPAVLISASVDVSPLGKEWVKWIKK